jgi:hypothetical protein
VLRPHDARRHAGTSRSWREHVAPRTAADVARQILHNSRITLATVHVSGVRDSATARQNVVDVSRGRPAHRSSYQNAPGGYTNISLRLLEAVERMGRLARITVSEVAGGSHAPGSAHYSGDAVDITVVNGRSVGGGAAYGGVASTCRAFGAMQIFDPGYDPYGGHNNHVHCQWP